VALLWLRLLPSLHLRADLHAPGGCDRTGYNVVDANSILLILDDVSPAQINFTDTDSALMQGRWVKGAENVHWGSFDLGSGLRMERLRIDKADRDVLDRAGQCDIGSSQPNTEFARVFQPCPTYGPYDHTYALDTASLPDGARSLEVCAQDYAQYQGLDHTGGESCDQRTVRTDNTAPGAPLGLQVVSANPARYLDHFGARFSLPPDPGSPIAKVHYDVINAAGNVVAPEHVLRAPTRPSFPKSPVPPKRAITACGSGSRTRSGSPVRRRSRRSRTTRPLRRRPRASR
jgi:hypothetical protein